MKCKANIDFLFDAKDQEEAEIIADNIAYYMEGVSIEENTIANEGRVKQKDEIVAKVQFVSSKI